MIVASYLKLTGQLLSMEEELLLLDFAYRTVLSHLDHFWELFTKFTVNNRECVDRN